MNKTCIILLQYDTETQAKVRVQTLNLSESDNTLMCILLKNWNNKSYALYNQKAPIKIDWWCYWVYYFNSITDSMLLFSITPTHPWCDWLLPSSPSAPSLHSQTLSQKQDCKSSIMSHSETWRNTEQTNERNLTRRENKHLLTWYEPLSHQDHSFLSLAPQSNLSLMCTFKCVYIYFYVVIAVLVWQDKDIQNHMVFLNR